MIINPLVIFIIDSSNTIGYLYLSKHSIRMIKIAEEMNKLEYFFGQLADQYTDEVSYQTNAISSLLEPLIIIFLGLAVGIILIAMYLPMFQKGSSF